MHALASLVNMTGNTIVVCRKDGYSQIPRNVACKISIAVEENARLAHAFDLVDDTNGTRFPVHHTTPPRYDVDFGYVPLTARAVIVPLHLAETIQTALRHTKVPVPFDVYTTASAVEHERVKGAPKDALYTSGFVLLHSANGV